MAERLTREQQRHKTRQSLLDAAERLFAERGIHQTSLEDVAEAVGLTKGAVYANFDGKTGLLMAILGRRGQPADPSDADAPTPGEGSADRWARGLADEYEARMSNEETRRFAMAVVEFWLYAMRNSAGRAAMAQALRTMREDTRIEIVRDIGHSTLPTEQLAALVIALDIGIAVQHLVDPSVPAELYGVGLSAMINAGRPSQPATRDRRGARPKA